MTKIFVYRIFGMEIKYKNFEKFNVKQGGRMYE